MPVIWPATSERNFTPTSTALGSDSAGVPGVVVPLPMEHGQVAAAAGAGLTMAGRKLASSATSNAPSSPGRTIRRTERRVGTRWTAVTTWTPTYSAPLVVLGRGQVVRGCELSDEPPVG